MKVSVIIPCYNQGHFLAEAIQSVLDQDYPSKEIIVVNDGSTDETRLVAARFDKFITYIEQPNLGAASARNAGIRRAKGEYIAFLDADDVCLPGRLSLEADILEQQPEVGLVAT
jgi:glycosyltransferase involved in cell wall biosynthesis